jgi:cell migration-inducing and hyaluronan-binding protein
VTTVVYPGCAITGSCDQQSEWSSACSNQVCYGVPLYRQYVTATEKANGEIPSIRMMGQSISQRSNLTANHGQYYIDTTVGLARQQQQVGPVGNVNVFRAGQTYYVFLVFAKPTTMQTYQLYVGKDPGFNPSSAVVMTRVNVDTAALAFFPRTLAVDVDAPVQRRHGHPDRDHGHGLHRFRTGLRQLRR